MALRFKPASEIKYHLYLSKSKLEMLYQQVASSGKGKKSFEWGVDVKAFKLTRKSEKEDEPGVDDKLKAILRELDDAKLVGMTEEPKDYFKGTLPMKWGLFNDSGRPNEEPPLVYFGGRTPTCIFGLGGSARHVVGNAGASAIGSRPVTPYLVAHILNGLGTTPEGWNVSRAFDGDEFGTYEAIALANRALKGPEQNLEFCAKTLLEGEMTDPSSHERVRVLLGTPLYVALASPYPADLSDY